jgi:hypothetical protein
MSEVPAIDLSLLSRQSVPPTPAAAPCSRDVVGFDHAVALGGEFVCKVCRWKLVAVTTYSDPSPRYVHGAPLLPGAIDDGARVLLEDALTLALLGLGVQGSVISAAFVRAHAALRR